jgi:hypothetical protein
MEDAGAPGGKIVSLAEPAPACVHAFLDAGGIYNFLAARESAESPSAR